MQYPRDSGVAELCLAFLAANANENFNHARVKI
jgi:hypothetical protein